MTEHFFADTVDYINFPVFSPSDWEIKPNFTNTLTFLISAAVEIILILIKMPLNKGQVGIHVDPLCGWPWRSTCCQLREREWGSLKWDLNVNSFVLHCSPGGVGSCVVVRGELFILSWLYLTIQNIYLKNVSIVYIYCCALGYKKC